ncbi:MAG: hypothetical protein LBI68_01500, partial [Azoarcus sp.]|jgi:hypothetical protein|nr:hypothetical protein [Azoarcus sp.]
VTWIGFPIPRNMGRGETGGTAALPMWISYMRTALAGMPETALPRPEGIASAPSDDGSRDDYHYAEFQPPELRPIEDDTLTPDDVFGGVPTSSQGGLSAPPSPVPQGRPGGQAPVPMVGGGLPPAPLPDGPPPTPTPVPSPTPVPPPSEQAPALLQDGQLPEQYDEHVLLPEP